MRVSRSRTSTLSTRSQKRSSTNQHLGITRTCTHLNMLPVHLRHGQWLSHLYAQPHQCKAHDSFAVHVLRGMQESTLQATAVHRMLTSQCFQVPSSSIKWHSCAAGTFDRWQT